MKSAGPGLFLIYLLGFFVIMMSTKAADEQVRPASSTRQPGDTEPVIIVGSGLAGLVAALEAVRNGAFVVIIDGEKEVGGNSAKASSGKLCSKHTEQHRIAPHRCVWSVRWIF